MRIGNIPIHNYRTASRSLQVSSATSADSPDKVSFSNSKQRRRLSPTAAAGALAAGVPGPAGLGLAAVTLRQLDVDSADAWEQAEKVYDELRARHDDVDRIAVHAGYSRRQVARIKAHLFYDSHCLDDRVGRFDASPWIANAWLRLDAGLVEQRDLKLLEHELFESHFEDLFHTDYRTAHAAANRSGRASGLE